MNILSQDKLAKLVNELRNSNKLTQEELGKLTNINRSMIVRLEKGDYIPSITQLEKLAEVLNFDIGSLFIENKPSYSTAFRKTKHTKEEQEDIDYLFDMMFAAKHQILLRRALSDEQEY
ncbi:MAG: helix-turn-helix domain-containing protein [Bacilli bacterium]|nr:helix-turn-helix domain-containing protein [Bacilli bacterium]